jgi:hypothetical protein
MANAIYELARQAFLTGSVNWTTASIGCALIASPYSANLTTDQYYGVAITAANVVASAVLTGTSNGATLGVADADDITFAAVSGSLVKYAVLYDWTAVPNTSKLLIYLDSATGIPVTPNGGAITITWDSGANRIFKL